MAEGGLRYNRFHVTALCSPTRAALLTGRNHHRVGFGSVGEFSGFPATRRLPEGLRAVPKILQGNGYSTAAFGKWHLTPDHQQGPAGPFDRWPTGWGFDHFWGFLGGEAGQYDPVITDNNTTSASRRARTASPITSRTTWRTRRSNGSTACGPRSRRSRGSSTTRPGAATRRTMSRRRGRTSTRASSTRAGTIREETFARQKELGVIPADADLTPRNEAFPAWDSLDDEKPFYARQMEVYAGFGERRLERRPGRWTRSRRWASSTARS